MKIGMQIVKALSGHVAKLGTRMLGCTACLVLIAASNSAVHAQFFNGGLLNRVVGGVSIDAQGMVKDATLADQEEVLRKMREHFRGASPDLAAASSLRMISLKGLQEKIAESVKSGEPLSEDVQFLGGLTRIEYVFVYPDRSDIVLAGPAENWTISKSGAIVGQSSGRPVLYLDDLLAAFRTVQMARNEGISVSIDPTEEGSQRLHALLKDVVVGPNTDRAQLEANMREAFGPQTVRLTGAPKDSHMARVLLAADYQMKRYGMNIIEAPVKGLPSYLDLIRNRSGKVPQNRWWMTCDYNAIEHTEDKMAWKLSGRGIKTLAEKKWLLKTVTESKRAKSMHLPRSGPICSPTRWMNSRSRIPFSANCATLWTFASSPL